MSTSPSRSPSPSPDKPPVPSTVEGPSTPHAIDCMCGPNSPWSQALEWCGWSTEQHDWLFDPTQDLSDPAIQTRIRCSPWPRRLRSATHLLGLPILSRPQYAHLAAKVALANALISSRRRESRELLLLAVPWDRRAAHPFGLPRRPLHELLPGWRPSQEAAPAHQCRRADCVRVRL